MSNPLSKVICRRCRVAARRDNPALPVWGRVEDDRWESGWVVCPVRLHGHEWGEMTSTQETPEHCPYTAVQAVVKGR